MANIKIQGDLKAALDELDTEAPMGFAQILPIHTATLNEVCKGLRKLDLCINVRRCRHQLLWADELDKKSRKIDEERIFDVVRGVVRGLPCLQELHLSHYFEHGVGYDAYLDVWGKSTSWMTFVGNRTPGYEEEVEDQGSSRRGGKGRFVACGGRAWTT